jgi:MT-A70
MVRGWAGARYSGRAFVWIKTKRSRGQQLFIHADDDLHMGQGYTTRKNAEDCLIFKAGRPERLARDVREPILAPAREHSRKPDEAIERIERLCAGPRVELFARESVRPNWDLWGNEVGKFPVSLLSPRPLLTTSDTASLIDAHGEREMIRETADFSKLHVGVNFKSGPRTG